MQEKDEIEDHMKEHASTTKPVIKPSDVPKVDTTVKIENNFKEKESKAAKPESKKLPSFQCVFCELDFYNEDDYYQHESICGCRSQECEICKKMIVLKYYHSHRKDCQKSMKEVQNIVSPPQSSSTQVVNSNKKVTKVIRNQEDLHFKKAYSKQVEYVQSSKPKEQVETKISKPPLEIIDNDELLRRLQMQLDEEYAKELLSDNDYEKKMIEKKTNSMIDNVIKQNDEVTKKVQIKEKKLIEDIIRENKKEVEKINRQEQELIKRLEEENKRIQKTQEKKTQEILQNYNTNLKKDFEKQAKIDEEYAKMLMMQEEEEYMQSLKQFEYIDPNMEESNANQAYNYRGESQAKSEILKDEEKQDKSNYSLKGTFAHTNIISKETKQELLTAKSKETSKKEEISKLTNPVPKANSTKINIIKSSTNATTTNVQNRRVSEGQSRPNPVNSINPSSGVSKNVMTSKVGVLKKK